MKESIRDFHGRIVGYIESDGSGSKTVRNFQNVILGYYDAGSDTTRDFQRRIIARGDICGIFFKDEIDF